MLSDVTVRGRVLPSDEQPKEQQRVTPVLCGFAEHEHHKEQHRKSRQQGQEEGQSHTLKQKGHIVKQKGFSCNEGQEEGQTSSLHLNYQLPVMERYGNVINVTAKSVTGIETPESLKESTAAHAVFLCHSSAYPLVLWQGWKGYPRVGRFSFTGSLNLFSPVAISRLRPWVTGSKIKGDCPMTVTCRLALLEGNSPILCTRRVRGYIALSFNSHQQARKEAHRLNAVVCGWNIAPTSRTRRANV